ncbi:hypothetical protein LINPERPRIM_LOCUS41582 [Linum perenne]
MGELLQRALVVRYWLAIAWRFRVYRISGGEFLVMASGSQSWASVVGTDDTDLSKGYRMGEKVKGRIYLLRVLKGLMFKIQKRALVKMNLWLKDVEKGANAIPKKGEEEQLK